MFVIISACLSSPDISSTENAGTHTPVNLFLDIEWYSLCLASSLYWRSYLRRNLRAAGCAVDLPGVDIPERLASIRQ